MRSSVLLSAFARLAVGLGLKGVLPRADGTALRIRPVGIISGAGPPFPHSRGIQRRFMILAAGYVRQQVCKQGREMS